MKQTPLSERLAVCSWSLQPTSAADLAAKLATTNIHRVQLSLDPLRDSLAGWEQTEKVLQQNKIVIVSAMFGCVGEDYSTLDSIRLTGGIAPDATWDQNLKNIRASAAIAAKLRQNLVTFHAGFLPHQETDPAFAKMLGRLREVADIFAAEKIDVGLETGQETGDALAGLLQKLDRPNVGVNFDPANMILYNKGEPVEALKKLAPWLRQVHIKDARKTTTPGTWGEEVPVGEGEVDWRGFFSVLKDRGFSGNVVIEREAGEKRIDDIRAAKTVVEHTHI
ncbi:MAG TPA: sugar phosphate isomerase/epimerase family protein [Verrucomicrobiae bacterium]|jgi:sugar phosphate isomerase/epimerase|nr:sugar phosphate isomerase/epimerase family protein [Verrucomicrobiae bacterium]